MLAQIPSENAENAENECFICVRPLVDLKPCKTCVNNWCADCDTKLSRCPFCRTPIRQIHSTYDYDHILAEIADIEDSLAYIQQNTNQAITYRECTIAGLCFTFTCILCSWLTKLIE